jgi:TetR/AcrR family transcriptional regulator, transcriptional repressor for nem operon
MNSKPSAGPPGPRARLVLAAVHLYRASSSEVVGITDITDVAAVKRGSFYYYFQSKQALTLAVIEREWEMHRQQVYDPAFLTEQPMAIQFQEFARRLHRFHRGMRREAGGAVGCPFANLACELAIQDHEVRGKVEEIFDRIVGYFHNALVHGLNNRELDWVDPRRDSIRDLIYLEGLLAISRVRDDIGPIADMAAEFPHLSRQSPPTTP